MRSFLALCCLLVVLTPGGFGQPPPDSDDLTMFPDLDAFMAFWSASWYGLQPSTTISLKTVSWTWSYIKHHEGEIGLEKSIAMADSWNIDLHVLDFIWSFREKEEILPRYSIFVQKNDLWFPVLRKPTKISELQNFAQFVHDQLSEAYHDLTGKRINFGKIAKRSYDDTLLQAQYDKIWNDIRYLQPTPPKWNFEWQEQKFRVWLPEAQRRSPPRMSLMDLEKEDDLLSDHEDGKLTFDESELFNLDVDDKDLFGLQDSDLLDLTGPKPSRSLTGPLSSQSHALNRLPSLPPMPTPFSPARSPLYPSPKLSPNPSTKKRSSIPASPERPTTPSSKFKLSNIIPKVFLKRSSAPSPATKPNTSQSKAKLTQSASFSNATASKKAEVKAGRPAKTALPKPSEPSPVPKRTSTTLKSNKGALPSGLLQKANQVVAQKRVANAPRGPAPPVAEPKPVNLDGKRSNSAPIGATTRKPVPKASQAKIASSRSLPTSSSSRTATEKPKPRKPTDDFFAVYIPRLDSENRDDDDDEEVVVPEPEEPDVDFTAEIPDLFDFMRLLSSSLAVDSLAPSKNPLRAPYAPARDELRSSFAYKLLIETAPLSAIGVESMFYPIFAKFIKEQHGSLPEDKSLMAFTEENESFPVFRMPCKRSEIEDFDGFLRKEMLAIGKVYFHDFRFKSDNVREQFAEIVAMFNVVPTWRDRFNTLDCTVTIDKTRRSRTIAKTVHVMLPTTKIPTRLP